jgi:hypothetical protein
VERATSLVRREGADVCDRSRRTVPNWAGATLAGAAFGFDPLSLRLTTALEIHSVEARHATAEVMHLRAERAWVGAFDQPMTKEQVLAVAKSFFAH